VAEIRARVESHARATDSDGLVICALSGGVDSAVAAALVHRAVGDRLTCIYVDHGLMRKRESELLRTTFEANLGMRLVMVDARQRFLDRLAGVEDPEQKRKIIGDEFIRVFEEEATKLGRIDFLTQGTLYPDVIESATSETKAAQKIKTHHNVGGLPADLRFKLIEPLRYLFKDEVRAVGQELGLPDAMVQRQPFPGPGLAIRIIGAVTAERLDTLREADWIVITTPPIAVQLIEEVGSVAPGDLDALAQLKRDNADVRVVFLTMRQDAAYARRAFEAGALGYVLKHSAPAELVLALRAALQGRTFVAPDLAAEVMRAGKATEADPVAALTQRQREVLQLLAEGRSAKEIASTLGLSTRTVEDHKYRLMESLDIENSAELIHFAIKHGLVQ